MQTNVKRMLRTGLITAACAALCCVSAAALTEGDWEYQLQGSEAQITDYHGAGGSVTVPRTIGGATVTELAGFGMFGEAHATALTIPGTIKDVDVGTHRGWEELERLTLESGVERINGCILQEYENLTQISLPSTLKEIGEHAFENTAITQITLPASVKKIEEAAFKNSALERADMSAMRNASLGVNLFAGCENLNSLMLPPDLKTIPQSLAQGCKSLTHIDIPASVTTFKNVAFSDCDLREINLPAGLKDTGMGTFSNNKNLTELIIPYGTTSAGSGGSFSFGLVTDNDNLKAVYVPDTVQSMGVNFIDESPNAIVYCGAGSYAEKFCQKYKISYQIDPSVNSTIHVRYNGRRISFGETGQNPVVDGGRTLVPLRAIFETMGATVGWDDATKTVTATRGGDTVRLTLGDKTLYKNGSAVMTLDVPAKSLNGRTVVPARAVAEAFGAQVGWNAAARIVTIQE